MRGNDQQQKKANGKFIFDNINENNQNLKTKQNKKQNVLNSSTLQTHTHTPTFDQNECIDLMKLIFFFVPQ